MGNRSPAPAVCVSSDRFKPLTLPKVATLLQNTGPAPHENDGNVDFVFTDAAAGFAFVADGVGHNYPTTGMPARQRERMCACWEQFLTRTSTFLRAQATGYTVPELESHIRGQLHVTSEEFCSFGKSSTFSMAMALTKGDDQSSMWVMCVSVADSGVVLVPSVLEPQARQLVNFDSQQLRGIEIGGDIRAAEITLQPVTPGSLVIGLTDGTLDAIAYMPRHIPPPPRAGLPIPEAVSGSGTAQLYGAQWMERCLTRMSEVVAQVEIAPGTELPAADLVLEALFDRAWHVTRDSPGLEPDDCASFAFYFPPA